MDKVQKHNSFNTIDRLDSGYNRQHVYPPAQSAVRIWTADLRIQEKTSTDRYTTK
jgi:hypothetical protein